MLADVDKPRAVLVVTGPTRERLYRRFRRLYAGRHDVAVVVERRAVDRRCAAQPVPVERRRAERRCAEPWLVFPPRSAAA